MNFVAAQFFILSFAFGVLFDPLGISFITLGVVYIFNHKLAYFELLAIFVLKGYYIVAFFANAWAAFYHGPAVFLPLLEWIAVPYTLVMTFYGSVLAVKLSGLLVKAQLGRRAPDLYAMIGFKEKTK